MGALGPVNAMTAYANGWHGVPIEAADEVQTGRLHQEANEEWRLDLYNAPPVPFGLLPNSPCAALPRSAWHQAKCHLGASRRAISALQRVCGHSVNRP